MSDCLFGFGAKTIGVISTKFGTGHPMGPVGDLEVSYIFGLTLPGEGEFSENPKNPNFPRTAQESFCTNYLF